MSRNVKSKRSKKFVRTAVTTGAMAAVIGSTASPAFAHEGRSAAPVVEPPTVIEPVAETPVQSATYIVQDGDNLVKIAKAHEKSWDEIASLNGIVSPFVIYPGQELKIEAEITEYVVQPGDTLAEIGEKLDIDWHELYTDNVSVIGDNPNFILPGQVYFVGGLPLTKPPVATEEVPTQDPVEIETLTDFVNPMPGTYISSEYGPRWGTMHNGIDFDGKMNDPIYSASYGTVKYTGIVKGYGGYGGVVVVTLDDGTELLYAHMKPEAIYVKPGDPVVPGQHIADVGAEGSVVSQSDGSHLHFEVRIGPGSVNSRQWLADRGIQV